MIQPPSFTSLTHPKESFPRFLTFCVSSVDRASVSNTSLCQHNAKKLILSSTLPLILIMEFDSYDQHLHNLTNGTTKFHVKAAQKCSHPKIVTWIAPKLLVFIIIEG